MDYQDLKEAKMYLGYVEFELKNVQKSLNGWESLNADEFILIANILKATGTKNYKELYTIALTNPNKKLVSALNGIESLLTQ